MEGRLRRQALREERTRSLSPEKRASISQSSSLGSINKIEGPNTPYLSSSSNLTSKEEEIRKTIAAIAGPSGTIPLFSQNKTTPAATSKPPASKTSSSLESVKAGSPPVTAKDSQQDAEKAGSLYSLPKKPSFKVAHKDTTEKEKEPLYSLPKKSPSTSIPKEKVAEEEPNEPFYSLPRKKPTLPKPVPAAKKDEEPDYALPKKPFNSGSKDEKEYANAQQKVSTIPIISPKPTNLSKPSPPAHEVETSSIWSQTSTPTIISSKPSAYGLRKFQNTSEHNNHNQLSSSINGKVPLPGMSKSNSFSVASTISNQQTPPRGSFLSTRPQPKFSSTPVDLTPKSQTSPAGNFLASRSPSPVSRSKSPVKGGFVQSAMLKRDSTLSLKSRTGSTDSPPPTLADSPVFSLANPVARAVSRSPSPTRASASPLRSLPPAPKKENDQEPPRNKLHDIDNDVDLSRSGTNNSIYGLSNSSSVENFRVSKLDAQQNEQPNLSSPNSSSPSKSDSRRWSPTRSSWLDSALKKNSSPTNERSGTSANRSSIAGSRPSSVFSKPPPPKPFSKSVHPTALKNDTVAEDMLAIEEIVPIKKEASKDKENEKNSVKEQETPSSDHDLPEGKVAMQRALSVKKQPPPPRLGSSTVNRAPSVSLQKPNKPKVSSEALERLRQLRAGNLKNGNSSDLDKLEATLNKHKLAKEGKSVDKEDRPALPKRPSATPSPPVPAHRSLPKTPEPSANKDSESPSSDGTKPAPKPLPPRPPMSRGTTAPSSTFRVPLPASLIPHTRSLEPELPPEPVQIRYQPLPDQDTTLDNAAIPTALNEKTAKSFAHNLSAVLQRGKQPLTKLEDTTTSFSPRFQRMTDFAGPKKSKTFDDNMLLPSSSSKQAQKSELKHMTKSRARGPKRRLPKAATAPASAAQSTVSLASTRGTASESASPHRSPSPPPFPRRPAQMESAAEIFAPSNTFKPKPVIRSGLNIPKTRVGLSDDARPKPPVIAKSSRAVSAKMNAAKESAASSSASSSPVATSHKPLPVPPKPRKLSASIAAE